VNDAPPLEKDGVVIVYLQYLKSFSPSPSHFTTFLKLFLRFGSHETRMGHKKWGVKKWIV
jgi:hypothetical protein